MASVFLFLGVFALLASAQYRVAPQFPEEYSANVQQWKWNDQGVNHSFVSTVYSSRAQLKMRTDTLSQQEGSTRVSRLAVSILDYSAYPTVVNTFAEASDVSLNATCGQYKLDAAAAFPPPAPSDYLNDPSTGSIFSGTFQRPDLVPNGFVDGWVVFLPGPTAVTFFFDSKTLQFVGYDFQSPVLRTGVTTRLYNFVLGPLDPQIFTVDPKRCPQH